MFFIWAAILVMVTVGVIVLLRPDSPERAIDDGRPRAGEDVTTLATEQATTKKKPKIIESSELPAAFGNNFPGLGVQPGGIRGNGASYSAEKHEVTIRWRARHPLGLVAYIVPTSTNNSQGSHVENSNSWSMSTVAFGNPDYAVAFVQARADGQPVTCEILIDGRVTDRRSTVGPYGSVWCQG
ncbi:hypothetical protein ASD81_17250 [Nocardioides sp. Root614]|nr:hypothetical protein ASD81_17250 [Nocardioides sp. Root614]KRA87833.1 hypothetical protein ASD84_17520 [Nocardioides sp. Root682]